MNNNEPAAEHYSINGFKLFLRVGERIFSRSGKRLFRQQKMRNASKQTRR